jgi:glycosyltransferase involved in cell wall biosynthesis
VSAASEIAADVASIAFVVPRYGDGVIGGAELAVQLLAEHLVSDARRSVDVYTTCALDPTTWADVTTPGSTVEGGVRVHRFVSQSGRHVDFDTRSEPVLRRSSETSLAAARQWVRDQGPVSPALLDAVSASDASAIVFSPYLYHPTVAGLPALRHRAVLHAAAHDEAPLGLCIYDEVFEAAAAHVFYTYGERELVQRRFPVTVTRPQIVLGLGSDPGDGDAALAAAAIGLAPDVPYLVCVGRVDEGKGTATLARFFGTYKQRHPGPLKLVFVGPVVHRPSGHDDIVVAGRVDEAVKWGLMRGARLLVSPSGYESFSFVVLEGWNAGVPVLVNGRCAATREHCERSGGGLWFEDYAGFEVCVERLLSDRTLAARMAARGASYVAANFRWSTVVRRYGRFIDDLVAARR